LWATLNDRIFGYLESVTLRHLVDNQRAKESGLNTVHDMRQGSGRGVAVSV
jgi:DNA-binding IscR family transcriptional regulator